MIKELQDSMDNQICSIQNYYSLLDTIITVTDNFLGVKHNLKHPVAAVCWTWDTYDIWVMDSLVDSDPDCIFTIAVFNNTDNDGNVYCYVDVLDNSNKFHIRKHTENCTEDKLINYFNILITTTESFRRKK